MEDMNCSRVTSNSFEDFLMKTCLLFVKGLHLNGALNFISIFVFVVIQGTAPVRSIEDFHNEDMLVVAVGYADE
jgi:hypothetical protein